MGGRVVLSVAAHGLVAALLASPWVFSAHTPSDVAASVEVVFGKNADQPAVAKPAPAPAAPAPAAPAPAAPAPAAPAPAAPVPAAPVPAAPVPAERAGAPADAAEARTEATLDSVPMPPQPSPAPDRASAEPDVGVADGGDVGLDFRRGEEGVVEAASDPGNTAPRYPEAAVARREHGMVVWRMFIDSDGRVDHVAAVHSSNFRDLDDAARVAFLRWHYRPARRGGVAVASVRDLTANFVLTAP